MVARNYENSTLIKVCCLDPSRGLEWLTTAVRRAYTRLAASPEAEPRLPSAELRWPAVAHLLQEHCDHNAGRFLRM